MDLVAIAVVKRAVGLDGLCGLHPHGETLGRLKLPTAVRIGEDERYTREAVLEKVSMRPQGYAAKFDVASDRTQAETMQGLSVYITEDQLPPLDEGEFYHFHLKGMAVVSQLSGKKLGTVRDTVNLPSTDALEVVLTNGNEVIIPYNDDAVIKVDAENKTIVVSDTYIEELI